MFQKRYSDEDGVNYYEDSSGTYFRVTRDGPSNRCLWSIYIKHKREAQGWECHCSVAASKLEVALARAQESYYRNLYDVDG